MSNISPFILVFILAVSSLVMLESTSGLAKPSAPEFTVKYVDNSYDIPPTPSSSTDPYTGKTTTTTIPGRHFENETIEVTIKNNLGASYYGLRYKGHYSNVWTYYPYNGPNNHNIMDSSLPDFQASNASYTVGSLYLRLLPQPIPKGAPIDVQVQALFGTFEVTPYAHAIDVGGPTYDCIFKGTAGDWSDTQTVEIGENAPTTSPEPTESIPEQTDSNQPVAQTDVVLGLSWEHFVIALMGIGIVVLAAALVFSRKRKTNQNKTGH